MCVASPRLDRRRVGRAIDSIRFESTVARARGGAPRRARSTARAAMRGVRAARELALATTAADERRGDAGASTGALGAQGDRALLVIDVQNDFAAPSGALTVRGGDGVARACSRCVEAFDRVVFAQDYHPAGHESFASEHAGKAPYDEVELAYGTQTLWPDHCVQGTWGCAFHDDLVVPARAMVVRKGHNRDVDSYSAFFENDRRSDTGLDEYLKKEGVKRVYVVGLAYDFCVKYTALDAKRLGYDAYVVRDCCAGVALPGTMEAAEKELADAGVVVLETLPA